jgi:hypothetical protein
MRSLRGPHAGLFHSLPQHPCAEVLTGALEIELLGDGHAIIAGERGAPLLLDQNRL